MALVALVGDLHLGRTVGGYDVTEDVLRALDGIAREAARRGCGAMIQLGDVFDEASPPPEVLAAGARALGRCAELLGGPVAALVGNHDLRHGEGRSDALDPLRAAAPGGVLAADAPAVLPLGGGAHALLLPYESRSRRPWRDAAERDAGIRELLAAEAPAGPLLVCGHLDLEGALLSSEALSRGGGCPWPAGQGWRSRARHAVDGHYHRPQRVRVPGWGEVTCAGTPVAMDFGEAREAKRWLIAEL